LGRRLTTLGSIQKRKRCQGQFPDGYQSEKSVADAVEAGVEAAKPGSECTLTSQGPKKRKTKGLGSFPACARMNLTLRFPHVFHADTPS
jgi:hypothetical protein